MKKYYGQKNWREVLPVKFWPMIVRFWCFLSYQYLITHIYLTGQTETKSLDKLVKISNEFFVKVGIFYLPHLKRGIFFMHAMYSYYVGKVDMRLTFTHSFPTGGRSGMSTRCDWFLALSALKQRGLTWHRYEYLSNC